MGPKRNRSKRQVSGLVISDPVEATVSVPLQLPIGSVPNQMGPEGNMRTGTGNTDTGHQASIPVVVERISPGRRSSLDPAHHTNRSQSYLESIAAESLAFAANASTGVQTQVSRLLAIIQKPVVDVLQLRAVVLSQGLPEAGLCAPSLRAIVWRLLLGTLPPVRAEWGETLHRQRTIYDQYVTDLVQEPELISYLRCGASNASPRRDDGHIERTRAEDHPLATMDSPSMWRRYWTDQDIFDQVNKDVFRTRPSMVDFFEKNAAIATRRGQAVTVSILAGQQMLSPKIHAFSVANIVAPKSHYDRLGRILFLFSKLNSGYVQGMNELLAPLYYTLFHDAIDGHFVEADAFFAFTAVMQEQRDMFCKSLDDSREGMRGRLDLVQQLLERERPAVAAHMKKFAVKIDFFALRWMMLVFAQEFDMPSIQVLWDAIFADTNRKGGLQRGPSLVHFVALAMIDKVKEAILAGDFIDIMRILQRFPPFDPRDILATAMKFRRSSLTSESIMSIGSEDPGSFIATELTTSPVHRKVVTTKKPSLSTRVINFVKRKPKPT